jgi:hypothetical protein
MKLPLSLPVLLALGIVCGLPQEAPCAQGQVWVVETGTPIDQIHEAVALASDGDVILVRPGAGGYQAFSVNGKSLTIQGDPSAKVWNLVVFGGFQGPAVQVSGLLPEQHLVLRNLEVQNSFNEPVPAVDVQNCAGSVHMEDCSVLAQSGPAVAASGAQAFTLLRTVLQSQGPFLPFGTTTFQVQPGLRVVNSNAHLFDCTVIGSTGKDSNLLSPSISDGGPGLLVNSGLVYVSGTSVSGGRGGGQSTTLPGGACVPFGKGGPGLVVQGAPATTRVLWLDSSAKGGEGGKPLPGCAQPQGASGVDQIVFPGSLELLNGSSRAFGVASPLRQGEQALLGFAGEPGDLRWLLISPGPNPGTFVDSLDFVTQLDPLQLTSLFLGPLPAESAELLFFPVPTLPASIPYLTWTAQCLSLSPSSSLFLSGPSEFVILGPGL